MPPDSLLTTTYGNSGALNSMPGFALNLLLAALLAFLLGLAYMRFGHALSNRRLLARNFLILTLTTTLIISIIKSSVALSLGLVGALSIVRFRAAIKDPEELAYLFLAISLGLGLGANQPLITIVAFVVIVGILGLRHLVRRRVDPPNLFLTVTCPAPHKLSASLILDFLTQSGAAGSLKRFDETPEFVEVMLQVTFKDVRKLEEFNGRLRAISDQVKLSYVEDRGLAV